MASSDNASPTSSAPSSNGSPASTAPPSPTDPIEGLQSFAAELQAIVDSQKEPDPLVEAAGEAMKLLLGMGVPASAFDDWDRAMKKFHADTVAIAAHYAKRLHVVINALREEQAARAASDADGESSGNESNIVTIKEESLDESELSASLASSAEIQARTQSHATVAPVAPQRTIKVEMDDASHAHDSAFDTCHQDASVPSLALHDSAYFGATVDDENTLESITASSLHSLDTLASDEGCAGSPTPSPASPISMLLGDAFSFAQPVHKSKRPLRAVPRPDTAVTRASRDGQCKVRPTLANNPRRASDPYPVCARRMSVAPPLQPLCMPTNGAYGATMLNAMQQQHGHAALPLLHTSSLTHRALPPDHSTSIYNWDGRGGF